MNNIYLIVGPSGSGKTTLADMASAAYGYRTVKSYTDRPPRGENDDSHIFVTAEQFDNLGPMAAYTEYHGHRYGVPADMIDTCDTYVIDPAGVDYLKKNYHGDKGIIVIGLLVSAPAAYLRQLRRGDSKETARARLKTDAEAFDGFVDICDYTINTEVNSKFICLTILNHMITVEERKADGLNYNNL